MVRPWLLSSDHGNDSSATILEIRKGKSSCTYEPQNGILHMPDILILPFIFDP